MPSRTAHPVVVLYEHPLLGEGIARIVVVETGVQVRLAAATDPDAVRAALADCPRVVIFERGPDLGEDDLSALAPHARLIDVSAAMRNGTGRPGPAIGVEPILAAVRAA